MTQTSKLLLLSLSIILIIIGAYLGFQYINRNISTVEINPKTVQVCTHPLWKTVSNCIRNSPIIESISGFNYDDNYSYVIKVERVKTSSYGYEDAPQYVYKLKEVVSKVPNN